MKKAFFFIPTCSKGNAENGQTESDVTTRHIRYRRQKGDVFVWTPQSDIGNRTGEERTSPFDRRKHMQKVRNKKRGLESDAAQIGTERINRTTSFD
jgi:hypothetical protein